MIASLLQVPINQLFIPRAPLVYWEPQDLDFEKRRGFVQSSAAAYTHLLQPVENSEECGEIVEVPINETPKERQSRLKAQRMKQNDEFIRSQQEKWNPAADPAIDASSDPFKTIIVARLSYETTEKKLLREFERFGPVRGLRLIKDQKTGKSRGYAFVEFEREKDAKYAVRDGDGLKIDGKRVLVDVERGRTVKGWRPRRLGGGLGKSRTQPGLDCLNRDNDADAESRKRTLYAGGGSDESFTSKHLK